MSSSEKGDSSKAMIETLPEQEYFFPEGLLGFPTCRRFHFARYQAGDGSESPFYMLQSSEDDVSFALVQPNLVVADYRLPVFPAMLAYLRAPSEKELVEMVIVTLRERLEEITINLQGPLILNPAASLGVQLVVEQYPVRHPLLQTLAG